MKGKFQNLVGRVFGELTVLRREGTSSPVMWRCLCACCGKESVTRAASLTQGLTKSCGQAENLAGKVFKNWTVISKAESSGYLTRWLCECVCGERQVIFAGNLKKGTA